jgi:tRNA uridine 5-carboxymethylaminomethyl modification enzyme
MLNTSKGPAVHSLRAQADKKAYSQRMKKVLESEPNLFLKQLEIVEIETQGSKVTGIVSKTGGLYKAKAVILACGTYLRSRIVIGEAAYDSGPSGLSNAKYLSESLEKNGIRLQRLKTGTPARAHKRSIDFAKLEPQYGDRIITPFSFSTKEIGYKNEPCFLAYTNEATHEAIRANLHRSPLFSGFIQGVGTRYCPSIEDKVVRFAEKPRHQLFVEPEGLGTDEMYLQGLSSSLPEDVQEAFLRTIKGFENIEVMRSA